MSNKNSKVKIKLSRKAGGLIFIACMFIGMGIGMMLLRIFGSIVLTLIVWDLNCGDYLS